MNIMSKITPIYLILLSIHVCRVLTVPIAVESDTFNSNETEKLIEVSNLLVEDPEITSTVPPPKIVVYLEGTCEELKRSPRFYTKNFILENDGKSQVEASLMVQISGTPNITCIEIVSRSDDKTRPYIISGGVGDSFVEVGVKTEYGKGFNLSINLYGSFFSMTTENTSIPVV